MILYHVASFLAQLFFEEKRGGDVIAAALLTSLSVCKKFIAEERWQPLAVLLLCTINSVRHNNIALHLFVRTYIRNLV